MKNKFIKHIESCLAKADAYNSKVNDEILDMEGMSGKKTRHFYNNICSMEDIRYLEIGVWKGSSLCAAMYGNEMGSCVAIDDFSEFVGDKYGDPKKVFSEQFKKHKGKNTAEFIEIDCWNTDIDALTQKHGRFNVYMYDGNHTTTSHFQALNYYLKCLDGVFIYLVDDWNWEKVRNGTLAAIKDNNLKTLYQKEIRTTNDNSHGYPAGKTSDWHNGLSIFVLAQQNYSARWFNPGNFDKFLGDFKNKKSNFLEIGSFEGLGTNYFIDTFLQTEGSKITCIDPWIKYSEATVANIPDWDDHINEETYEIFKVNTQYNKDKIIVKRGLSSDIVPELSDAFYDFIYVDGDHSEDAVWLDAINSFAKLKSGGVMIFDDYKWNNGKKSPEKAIDRFLDEYKDLITLLEINHQVTVVKK